MEDRCRLVVRVVEVVAVPVGGHVPQRTLFVEICFKTLFKLKYEVTYIRSGSIYLPSTSGAFFARVEGGSMGRGQSNRFSPYWEHRGEI